LSFHCRWIDDSLCVGFSTKPFLVLYIFILFSIEINLVI
jgi:hypothetical protein